MKSITRKTVTASIALAFLALTGCAQQPPEPRNASPVQLKKINQQLETMNATLKQIEANQAEALTLQRAQYAAQVEGNSMRQSKK
ncbi:TPA: hypothetical protein ACYSE6_006601 [Pseudomonas aeruginosa]